MTFNFNWNSSECDLDIGEHFETEDDIIHDHWFTPGILLFKIPEFKESKPQSNYPIAQNICQSIEQIVELEKPAKDSLDDLYKQLKEQREKETGGVKSKDGAKSTNGVKSKQVIYLQEQIKNHRKKKLQPLAKRRRHFQRELVAYEKYRAWGNNWPDNAENSKQIHEMTPTEKKVVEYYAKLMPRTGKKGQNKKNSAGHRILKHINSETFKTMVNFDQFQDTTIQGLVQNIRFHFQNLSVKLENKPKDKKQKQESRKEKRKASSFLRGYRKELLLYLNYYKENRWQEAEIVENGVSTGPPKYMTEDYQNAMKYCQMKFVPSKKSNNNVSNSNSNVPQTVFELAQKGVDNPSQGSTCCETILLFKPNNQQKPKNQKKPTNKNWNPQRTNTEKVVGLQENPSDSDNDDDAKTPLGVKPETPSGSETDGKKHEVRKANYVVIDDAMTNRATAQAAEQYVPSYLRPFT